MKIVLIAFCVLGAMFCIKMIKNIFPETPFMFFDFILKCYPVAFGISVGAVAYGVMYFMGIGW